MKTRFLFLALCAFFASSCCRGQVLVDLVHTDTIDHAYGQMLFYAAQMDGDNNLFLSYNIHADGENTLLIGELSNEYHLEWMRAFPGTSALYKAGVDVTLDKGYMYVTGGEVDSASASAIYHTIKLRASDGDTLWSASYQGSYSGYTFAANVVLDDTGNVYVVGTEQSGPVDTKMTLVKYDSTGAFLWAASYDSVGMFDGGVAMLPPNSRTITCTGFSGTGWGSWDFNTVDFSPGGSVLTWNRSSNGSGNFSQPVALRKDEHQNIYVLGTSTVSGTNTDFKLIKYDSLFHEQWVETWGDPNRPEKAVMLQYLNATQTLVAIGTARNARGGSDIVTLAYNTDGTPLWSRTVSAPNPIYEASAVDMIIASDDNIYVTGKSYNGIDTDMVLISYDMSGNVRIAQKFSRGAGIHDAPKGIYEGDAKSIVVTLTSEGPDDTLFLALQYAQMELGNDYYTDTSGNPIYIKDEVIIKFDNSVVNKAAVNDIKQRVWSASDLLEGYAIDSLQAYLPFDIQKDCKFVRIYTDLKTTDTISISRMGEEIPIPDFWSTFIMTIPTGFMPERSVCEALSPLFPLVEFAELNTVAKLSSVPNDPWYEQQLGLHPSIDYPNSDSNLETAWDYTTGKPFVKIGIFDDGVAYANKDLLLDTNDVNTSIVKGGANLLYGGPLIGGPAPITGTHGTMCAGLIAARRNNGYGIAGVAGGNGTDSTTGCSLYGYEIVKDGQQIISASTFANAMILASSLTPDSSYGTGINVLNHSYSFLAEAINYGYYVDSNIALWRNGFKYSFRNKVVNSNASGNHRQDALDPPATLEDDWILVVGGTGVGGYFKYQDDFFNPGWQPNFGFGMDIAAMSSLDVIPALQSSPFNPMAEGFIADFGSGTSASAPLATGAAGLLMSYFNDPIPVYKNMAPEDVEYILQRSAFNIDSPGYDLLTGYGRLNVGGALQVIDTAQRKLIHFDSDSFASSYRIEQIYNDLLLRLYEPERSSNGLLFGKGNYTTDVYKVTCTVPHMLLPIDTIVGSWPRSSSSFVYREPAVDQHLLDSILVPRERLYLESVNNTEAVLYGYVYNLKNISGVSYGWLPFDTTAAKSSNFAYSLLIGSEIQSPWDSLISSAVTITADDFNARLFPNPATGLQALEITTEATNKTFSIKLLDALGSVVMQLFNGEIQGNRSSFVVDMSSYSNGVYFYSIQSPGKKTQFLKTIKY